MKQLLALKYPVISEGKQTAEKQMTRCAQG